MNPFIKSNKPWLSLLGLAVIIVILGFIFKPKEVDFKTNAEQAVKLMGESQMQVSVSDLPGKQLIDIRSAELYIQSHPENAINIPVRNLLDDEALELLDEIQHSGQVAVLYGSDELQAVAPTLLLAQMGYTNLKTLKGGYIATNELKVPALPSTEVMLLDTAAINVESALTKAPDTEKKKSQVVVPVRKEVSAGGGC
jgi:rhodanese-related sulfurtransferase